EVALADRELDRVARLPEAVDLPAAGIARAGIRAMPPPDGGKKPRLHEPHVGAARLPEPEGARPALLRLAAVAREVEERVADAVEVRVARLGERRREIHALVYVRVPVVPDAMGEVLRCDVRAGARSVGLRLDQVFLERRDCGERLERRARRIQPVERPVERRVVAVEG